MISGLKKLQQNGFLLVIVTNQSGVARGYYKEEDIEVLHVVNVSNVRMGTMKCVLTMIMWDQEEMADLRNM